MALGALALIFGVTITPRKRQVAELVADLTLTHVSRAAAIKLCRVLVLFTGGAPAKLAHGCASSGSGAGGKGHPMGDTC